jgi:hypothetical protein
LTPPLAVASRPALSLTPESTITTTPLPTQSPTPLTPTESARFWTPTSNIPIMIVPTTVVLDNGLAWTECEVPNQEYGMKDEEILTKCAPKPIWGAADQQRMGQKKETNNPTFSDLQITIGTDRYETRFMNWEMEGC